MSTGPGVMAAGKVMWETGFEGSYNDDGWGILMPTTMFRVGVSDFAEVRLEYDGSLVPIERKWGYEVDPLVLGTKLKICDGRISKKVNISPSRLTAPWGPIMEVL